MNTNATNTNNIRILIIYYAIYYAKNAESMLRMHVSLVLKYSYHDIVIIL